MPLIPVEESPRWSLEDSPEPELIHPLENGGEVRRYVYPFGNVYIAEFELCEDHDGALVETRCVFFAGPTEEAVREKIRQIRSRVEGRLH